ncbi:MAG TPA: hypothetical protein VIC51_15380 [Psychromonas sp.]
MKITVREWRKLIEACATPKNKQEIGQIVSMSDSSVHKHINLFPKGWLTVFNEKREGDAQIKLYFVKAKEVSDTEIIKAYQKVHSNYHQSDVQFEKPMTLMEKSFIESEKFRDTGKPIKEKQYTVEKAITHISEGHMCVRGLDGYHSGTIKRARPKTFVGSSDNLI